MLRVSGAGALFGRLIHHAAALASTCREKSEVPQHCESMRLVAQYARTRGAPFRVIHDLTVNRPYGRFAVYVGEKRVGAQLSFPSEADCHRMESPTPIAAPYEKRVSPAARLALGMITNQNSNPQAREIAIRRARRVSRRIHQSIYRKNGS